MKLIRDIKQYYLNNKEYWPFIIVIPSLIGGIWQTLELLFIDPSLIRFFSVSQLIPDGLLILSYIILITFIFRLVGKILNLKLSAHTDQVVKKFNYIEYFGSLAQLLFGAFLIYNLWPAINYPKNIEDVQPKHIFVIIFVLSFSFPHLIRGLVGFIQQVSYCHPRTFKKIERTLFDTFLKQQDGKIIPNDFSTYLSSILFISMCAVTFVLLYSLRNQIVKPSVVENFKNAEKRFSEKYHYNKVVSIRYFNDKYIFIQVKNKKSSSEINDSMRYEIIKMENLILTDFKQTE